MTENERLYIPSYVKAKQEYFPGFGKQELYITIIMSMFVLFFSVIFWGLLQDMAVVVLTILIGISGSIGVNTRLEGNISIRMFVMLFFSYMKEQQIFLYRYQDWRKDER